MVSKLQQHEDVEKYLIQSGLQENLLHCGFIATIRAVEKKMLKLFCLVVVPDRVAIQSSRWTSAALAEVFHEGTETECMDQIFGVSVV